MKPIYLKNNEGFPYSESISFNNLVWTSGHLGYDENGQIPDDFEQQVSNVFDRISETLLKAETTIENVLKCSVFVKDIELLGVYNRVYIQKFNPNKLPVRTTVEVSKFQGNVLIEVDVIAYKE